MNSDKLAKLQSILLFMMEDIKKICESESIEYFLGGGSLLGAVRNNGFIPWDDDVDLMMTRENYDKFISIVGDKLPDKYFVQNWIYDKNWHYGYTKIRLNNTKFSTQFTEQFKDMHQGIFVDIFVQDYTSSSKLMQKKQIFQIRLWHSVVRYLWRKKDSSDKHISAPLLTKFVSVFSSIEKAKKNLDKAMRQFNNKKHNLLIDSSGMHLKSGGYNSEWLSPAKKLKFESTSFSVPNDYDSYLKSLYGDYMTPKQYESHDAGTHIDFGIY